MSDDDISPDEGPVTDPQELERVMLQAMEAPALMGPLMRMLLGARLWVYVPPHPELEGEHVMDAGQGFTWNMYRDPEGDYAAVFTSLRAAKDKRRSHLWTGDGPPAMAEIPAKVLFHFLNNGRTHVRVTAHNCASIRLEPEAVAKLVAGEFTEQQSSPPPGPYETLIGVPSAEAWEEPQMESLREATPLWPVMRGR